MAHLEIRGVEKSYSGGIVAARGVDLSIDEGELFVVVGPSGSGKSTLLRILAGLEDLDAGTIFLEGRRIDLVPPWARDVAMVFQDQVLYPHLDVFENIAFGLRARNVPKPEVVRRVEDIASALDLFESLRRLPATLSGGQRRRVTLGRAFVLRPRLLLLDEPFIGLDAPLRAAIRTDLAALARRIGTTIVLVTHDQEEALALGDRLAVLDQGQIVQVGSPAELYDRPKNRFVARFLGQPSMNILPCEVGSALHDLLVRLEGTAVSLPLENGDSSRWKTLLPRLQSGRIEIGLRPEALKLSRRSEEEQASPTEDFVSTVRRIEHFGHENRVWLDLGPHSVVARVPSLVGFTIGERVNLVAEIDRASWFDTSTGERLD